MSERIQLIIEAAERAAAGIIDDAEAQATQYLQESRRRADRIAAQRAGDMWALTDDLIARAEAVKRQSDDLVRALGQAKRGVAETLRADAGQLATPPEIAPWEPMPPAVEQAAPALAPDGLRPLEPQPSSAALSPPPPPVRPATPVADDASRNPPSEGARLLATQMAVAGSSRAEIESRLQHEFGIRDTGPMLDAILGSGRRGPV